MENREEITYIVIDDEKGMPVDESSMFDIARKSLDFMREVEPKRGFTLYQKDTSIQYNKISV